MNTVEQLNCFLNVGYFHSTVALSTLFSEYQHHLPILAAVALTVVVPVPTEKIV